MHHDSVASPLMAEEAAKGIRLPPCPATLTKLLREMRDDEPDFVKIAKLISTDVSLAGAMLKTVNSSFYGLRTKVGSVHQALNVIGLRNAGQLVTGLLLRDAFPSGATDRMQAVLALDVENRAPECVPRSEPARRRSRRSLCLRPVSRLRCARDDGGRGAL